MANTQEFRDNLIASGILDPEGIHHEFRGGLHGQKLDFEKIDETGSLYDEWVVRTADFVRAEFRALPDAVIGVAEGTNRFAIDVARRLGEEVVGLVSKKNDSDKNILELSEPAQDYISSREPEFLVVLEDVGTTGSNSAQVADACLEAGADDVAVVVTWQRWFVLDRLDEIGIPYKALIRERLPAYKPEDCHFCQQGWELVPRAGDSN
jgi:orotate phosphoribosyltransferase-like protein